MENGESKTGELSVMRAESSSPNMRAIWKGEEDQHYQTYDGREVAVSRNMLVSLLGGDFAAANVAEQANFMAFCIATRMDPMRKQVYFIRYKRGQPPSFVVNWEVLLDRANRHPQYDGKESGVVWEVTEDGKSKRRRGKPCDFAPDEKHVIVGGWAKVWRKDRRVPCVVEVPLSEMEGIYWDNEAKKFLPNRTWNQMPTTMATKTPTARALRQSFPEELHGLYTDIESASFAAIDDARLQSGQTIPIESMDELAESVLQEQPGDVT